MTAKLACALILLAAAARVCAVTPSCDGPPYGDTPANYQAWAEQFATFPLGPPKGLLSEVCDVKFHHGDRARLHDLGLTDRVINDNSPVIVANYELAAIARRPYPTPQPDTRVYAVFLCLQITESCRLEDGPFPTPEVCAAKAKVYTQMIAARPQNGRYYVRWGSNAMWYECRSRHVDTWEPEQ